MSTHIFIGPPALLLTSFEQMSSAIASDWSDILERLSNVPAAMAGYRESLQVGMSRKLMAPRSMTLAVAR